MMRLKGVLNSNTGSNEDPFQKYGSQNPDEKNEEEQ